MEKNNKHTNILKNTVKILSSEESYNKLYHKPKHGEKMPSVETLNKIVSVLRRILFPGYFGNTALRQDTMEYHIGVNTDMVLQMLAQQIKRGLCFDCKQSGNTDCDNCDDKAAELTARFIEKLPNIRTLLATDVEAAYLGDPASRGYGEVIFSYPSIRTITNFRIAHELFRLGVPLIPRIITEMAHSETGVDIHPGAEIGEYFFIDHGTGVVIGETCIIGNNVKIYQGVTLGAKSFPLDEDGNPVKGIPRHPVVKDNVVIYAHATILGRITIGENSIIGGNVWVTNDLPARSRVAQQKIRESGFRDGAGI